MQCEVVRAPSPDQVQPSRHDSILLNLHSSDTRTWFSCDLEGTNLRFSPDFHFNLREIWRDHFPHRSSRPCSDETQFDCAVPRSREAEFERQLLELLSRDDSYSGLRRTKAAQPVSTMGLEAAGSLG
jgi:hypothetical protein